MRPRKTAMTSWCLTNVGNCWGRATHYCSRCFDSSVIARRYPKAACGACWFFSVQSIPMARRSRHFRRCVQRNLPILQLTSLLVALIETTLKSHDWSLRVQTRGYIDLGALLSWIA